MAATRTTKVIGFSVPPAMVREVEAAAAAEGRTKSELFREMWRVYVRYVRQRDMDEMRWVENLIAEAQAEEAAHPMTEEEFRARSKELAAYGAAQAKKLGIKPKDINRIIHEHRRARRAAGRS